MTVGERIKTLRERKGLSVYELSAKSGINPQHLYRYENGEVNAENMTAYNLERLAKGLNCEPGEIMGWSDISDNLRIPLYSKIAAGASPDENIEGHISVDASLSRRGDLFAVRMDGNEMHPTLWHGDIAVIRSQKDIESRDIGCVILDGKDAIIREMRYSTTQVTFVPHNEGTKPFTITWDEARRRGMHTVGKVVQIIRTL